MDSIYANISLYAKLCNEGDYGSGTTLLTVDKIAEDKAGTYTADITKHITSTYPHYVYTSYDCFYVYSTTANIMVRNYYCPTIDIIVEYNTRKYTITTKVSPTGAGTVTGGGTYEYGTTIELKATAAQGYKFTNRWKDEAEGVTYPGETRSVYVDIDKTYIALFEVDKINKIYVGTSQPKDIYIGTSKVKGIYIGTTKVYG